MDALNDDWLDNMERWGNARVNAEWQAQLPAGYPLPTATDADNQTIVLDRYIRDKYERLRFKKGARPQGASLGSNPAAKATGGGGGWNDDEDWSSSPAPTRGGGPSLIRAPSGDQPPAPPGGAAPAPPKLKSGAYSSGTMKGFGNPNFAPPPPSAGGLLSGALSGLVSATTSVVQSAVPLVQNSLDSARPLVANMASGLA
jgi:hypothetical protein